MFSLEKEMILQWTSDASVILKDLMFCFISKAWVIFLNKQGYINHIFAFIFLYISLFRFFFSTQVVMYSLASWERFFFFFSFKRFGSGTKMWAENWLSWVAIPNPNKIEVIQNWGSLSWVNLKLKNEVVLSKLSLLWRYN